MGDEMFGWGVEELMRLAVEGTREELLGFLRWNFEECKLVSMRDGREVRLAGMLEGLGTEGLRRQVMMVVIAKAEEKEE